MKEMLQLDTPRVKETVDSVFDILMRSDMAKAFPDIARSIVDRNEPCRYACAGFPMCGCEVESLYPPTRQTVR